MKNGIYIKIKANSIYGTSVSTVSMFCDNHFEIINHSDFAKILTIKKGNIRCSSNTLEAIQNSYGKFELEFIIIGLFLETKFKVNCYYPYCFTYGTFLYPFVASQIFWTFESKHEAINNIVVELPDTYRLLFYKSKVRSKSGGGFSLPKQSFDLPNTLHVFNREGDVKDNQFDQITIDIPIRMGGKDLNKMVSSPIRFSFLTLVSTFICSIYLKDPIVPVFASVLALWSFLFERYINSHVPQNQTLLKKLYNFLTVIVMLASIPICIFNSLRILQISCFFFFTLMLILIRLSFVYFKRYNSLPRAVELLFEFIINIEDWSNKNVRIR